MGSRMTVLVQISAAGVVFQLRLSLLRQLQDPNTRVNATSGIDGATAVGN
uniref:Uncharacterized protein n=1 Tax=Aegilops tauschii subsp. strangulata TaxID=200361 RepID=A0A453IB22_AEGTS